MYQSPLPWSLKHLLPDHLFAIVHRQTGLWHHEQLFMLYSPSYIRVFLRQEVSSSFSYHPYLTAHSQKLNKYLWSDLIKLKYYFPWIFFIHLLPNYSFYILSINSSHLLCSTTQCILYWVFLTPYTIYHLEIVQCGRCSSSVIFHALSWGTGRVSNGRMCTPARRGESSFGSKKCDVRAPVFNEPWCCLLWVLGFSHTQHVPSGSVLMLMMVMTANNIDLWDTQEESCSHLGFQESELFINAEFF